jgi:hypothetical protein
MHDAQRPRLLGGQRKSAYCLRFGDLQIPADLARKKIVDFIVSWDGGCFLCLAIDINRMIAALA